MTTADFRFGNYFQDPAQSVKAGESFLVVNSIGPYHINEYHISVIKPILITKEWLVKLGFTDRGQVTKDLATTGYTKDDLLLELNGNQHFTATLWKIEGRNDGNSFTRLKTVLFLHELQNLYYTITNKELTL